jgi:hypothetical protein
MPRPVPRRPATCACWMFCITHGTTPSENPRPFGSRLREPAATACLRGGARVRGLPGPSAWPRRSPKVRHNNHRREPSSRYSPRVSPRHTAAGTTPGRQPFTLQNTAMCARPGRSPAPVTRPAPGVLREPARTLRGDGAGRSPHPKPGAATDGRPCGCTVTAWPQGVSRPSCASGTEGGARGRVRGASRSQVHMGLKGYAQPRWRYRRLLVIT